MKCFAAALSFSRCIEMRFALLITFREAIRQPFSQATAGPKDMGKSVRELLRYPIWEDRILNVKIHTTMTNAEAITRLKRAQGTSRASPRCWRTNASALESRNSSWPSKRRLVAQRSPWCMTNFNHCLERMVRNGSRSPNDTIREGRELTKHL